MENSCVKFEKWRPKVDASMEGIKLELRKMNKQWDQVMLDMARTDHGLLDKHESSLDHQPPLSSSHGPTGTVKIQDTRIIGMGQS
jgi:hypothetical protein